MSPPWKSLVLVAFIAGVPSAKSLAADLEWVRVADDGKGFVQTASGNPFVPWGFRTYPKRGLTLSGEDKIASKSERLQRVRPLFG